MSLVESKEALHIRIDKLDELRRTKTKEERSYRNSIFKVPKHLHDHDFDEKLYEPQVVSIGPYHRGKAHLKPMEDIKLDYLLKLTGNESVQNLMEKLREKEQMARECYVGSVHHINQDEFIEMMLLDGCFVIQVMREAMLSETQDENLPYLTRFTLERTKRDLLLLENQLPFFILVDLFDATKPESDSFDRMAAEFLRYKIPARARQPNLSLYPENQNFRHLLGFLHNVWIDSSKFLSKNEVKLLRSVDPKFKPSDNDQSPMQCTDNNQSVDPKFKRLLSFLHNVWINSSKIFIKKKDENTKNDPLTVQFIPCATQLREAGVLFKPMNPNNDDHSATPEKKRKKDDDDDSIFLVKFEKGIMRFPVLSIDGDTESIFRNLVAYEQGPRNQDHLMPLTDYIVLMDCLINTGEDVTLLCESEVIQNSFDDHVEVALMINRLRRSLLLPVRPDDFSYRTMFIDVNNYYNKAWNKWKANLRQNYFNTPWALISFLAAVFLIALTVIQTVYTVYP